MAPPPGATVPFWPPYSSASKFNRRKPPQRHPATHDEPRHAKTLATSLRQAASPGSPAGSAGTRCCGVRSFRTVHADARKRSLLECREQHELDLARPWRWRRGGGQHPSVYEPPSSLMWTAPGQQDFFVCQGARFGLYPAAVAGQSRPNPRGGSMAWSSARSWSQIACNALASALSCRLAGSASSQPAYCVCNSPSSATASRHRRARPRWSVGRRVRTTGVSAVRAAR